MERILEDEPGLLDVARTHMPSLPVDDIDILMLDRMGKDISGAGLDPNIIGRNMIRGEPEPDRPRIKMITIHDLTDASHGNAVGMGLGDVITRRLYGKIDLQATNENIVTSSFLLRGKIPVIAPDDATAFAYASRGCGRIATDDLRVVRVRDTLRLGEAYVSDAVLHELKHRTDIEVVSGPVPAFDEAGALWPF